MGVQMSVKSWRLDGAVKLHIAQDIDLKKAFYHSS